MHLTFLKGTSPKYKPAKTYEYKQDTGITKTSDYDIGYTFHWNSFSHTEDLKTLTETIRNFANAGWFRINGAPTLTVSSQPALAIRRLSENFPEQPTRFASFDLDGVPISQSIAAKHNWNLSDPISSAAIIRDTLTELGLYSLSMSDFIVLFTSSQFTRTKLNCHLYFIFETPKKLEELRSITTGFNTFHGTKILDPAPYNPVQPDYISPPICTNFADPIPANARLFYSPGLAAMVPEDLFQQNMKVVQPVGWSQSGVAEPLAKNWLDSVRLYVGTERGINEPAFRAASQMVHEIGRSTILQDIDKYAKQLHDECWNAILAHGGRGDTSDRRTYDVARFKQYLESATRPGKNFGLEIDNSLQLVTQAIEKAAVGDLADFTGRQCVSEMVKLRDRFPAAWTQVKVMIKVKLRGKLNQKDIDNLMKGVSATSPLVPGGHPLNPLVTFDNENDMIRPLLAEYNFIRDQNENMYVRSREKKHILPLSSGLIDVFYRDGLLKSNNRVGLAFGKKCVSVLMADKDNPTRGSMDFTRLVVGKRTLPLGTALKDGTWYNAGEQPDGIHRSIKLDINGPVIHENSENPVWLPVTPNILPTLEMLERRFPAEDPAPEFLIKFFKDNILNYITCDLEDLPALTSWLVTAMTSRPLSYLAEFIGPHNCGKSTGADLAKDLIDPTPQPLGSGAARSVFTGSVDENFFALLNNQWITILDNVGLLSPQTQDVLCQVSTGMKYNVRILYTQNQLEQYIQRPMILTGISKIITRSDLMSRTMTINFNQLPRYNTDFLDDWRRDKPFLFGGLLHIVARAIQYVESFVPTKASQVSPRDIVFGAVNGVLNGKGKVDEDSVTVLLNDKYADQILSSEFGKLWIAFTQAHQQDFTLHGGQQGKEMEKWIFENIGRTVEIQLNLSSRTVKEPFKITPKGLPGTTNKLGWAMNKLRHAFNLISGWEMKEIRKNWGKERQYTRKPLLTELF